MRTRADVLAELVEVQKYETKNESTTLTKRIITKLKNELKAYEVTFKGTNDLNE